MWHQIEEARRMHERGGDEVSELFENMHGMLDKLEEHFEEKMMRERSGDPYYEAPMSERRSSRTGRYMR